MIHEAYMPVYRCPDFHCAVRTYGPTRGSTRGPRGPKNHRKLMMRQGTSLKHFIYELDWIGSVNH